MLAVVVVVVTMLDALFPATRLLHPIEEIWSGCVILIL